mmetsp:Transcript_6576/g.18404  ORF Transcript_6576/g.18404 Transcript_6576/m.18404 type:complete len:234 (+) Transcript_6576:1781-2482(+)
MRQLSSLDAARPFVSHLCGQLLILLLSALCREPRFLLGGRAFHASLLHQAELLSFVFFPARRLPFEKLRRVSQIRLVRLEQAGLLRLFLFVHGIFAQNRCCVQLHRSRLGVKVWDWLGRETLLRQLGHALLVVFHGLGECVARIVQLEVLVAVVLGHSVRPCSLSRDFALLLQVGQTRLVKGLGHRARFYLLHDGNRLGHSHWASGRNIERLGHSRRLCKHFGYPCLFGGLLA